MKNGQMWASAPAMQPKTSRKNIAFTKSSFLRKSFVIVLWYDKVVPKVHSFFHFSSFFFIFCNGRDLLCRDRSYYNGFFVLRRANYLRRNAYADRKTHRVATRRRARRGRRLPFAVSALPALGSIHPIPSPLSLTRRSRRNTDRCVYRALRSALRSSQSTPAFMAYSGVCAALCITDRSALSAPDKTRACRRRLALATMVAAGSGGSARLCAERTLAGLRCRRFTARKRRATRAVPDGWRAAFACRHRVCRTVAMPLRACNAVHPARHAPRGGDGIIRSRDAKTPRKIHQFPRCGIAAASPLSVARSRCVVYPRLSAAAHRHADFFNARQLRLTVGLIFCGMFCIIKNGVR